MLANCSLIIANPEDQSAFWLYQQLKEAGLDIEFITPMDLIGARKWTVWLSDNEKKFSIELSDGRQFSTDTVFGAINRVNHLPSEVFSSFGEDDQVYGESEFHALFLSFLTEIPGPVLNRPSPRWLAGYMAYDVEWKKMANRVGLPLYKNLWQSRDYTPEDYSRSNQNAVIIVNDQVISKDLDLKTQTACKLLAENTNSQLLEIFFEEVNNTNYFCSATPFVNLQRGGQVLVNTVKSMFIN
jgi:hypothetical protein